MSAATNKKTSGKSIWTQARDLAIKTPETRNRYVDFLRALSICAVVFGHWLMAAPYISDGSIAISNMLEHQAWTRWLTWGFQVMPVFFLVGGYSNGVSWQSALERGQSYSEWLQVRLQRLIGPVLPLILLWMVIAACAQRLGVHPTMVKVSSQMALIPVWFLAVYVMVAVLAPAMYGAWKRFGFLSFGALAVLAVANDLLFFSGVESLGWLNYGFVWLAVHQLGFAWRDGYLAGARQGLAWMAGGLLILGGLIVLGPYPVSMVSVPGQEISNTLPPKVTLLALGIAQCGLLLSMEKPMRRWLARLTPWTWVVLINSMIMTVFLWHLTASTLSIGAALLLNDIGLKAMPGSGAWWMLRPAWIAVYSLALLPFALLFGRFERSSVAGTIYRPWRLILSAVLACAGLALIALDGVAGDGVFGLRVWVLLLPFAGAVLAGINPLRR